MSIQYGREGGGGVIFLRRRGRELRAVRVPGRVRGEASVVVSRERHVEERRALRRATKLVKKTRRGGARLVSSGRRGGGGATCPRVTMRDSSQSGALACSSGGFRSVKFTV